LPQTAGQSCITFLTCDKLKAAGVDDPAGHFKGKTIRVSGKVIRKDDRPRIEVDAATQIKVVEKKP
jgi:hypothetical protein